MKVKELQRQLDLCDENAEVRLAGLCDGPGEIPWPLRTLDRHGKHVEITQSGGVYNWKTKKFTPVTNRKKEEFKYIILKPAL